MIRIPILYWYLMSYVSVPSTAAVLRRQRQIYNISAAAVILNRQCPRYYLSNTFFFNQKILSGYNIYKYCV